MNTFDITLGMLSEAEHGEAQRSTGCSLSFRAAAATGQVEIWARVPKPRKGQGDPQFEDVRLGLVHVPNLMMTLEAVQTLTTEPRQGGHCT